MTTDPYLKLLLIRHAESMGNRLGQMEGQRSTALTQQGCQQATRLRASLRRTSAKKGLTPTVCYSSPLLRALQTAAILCGPETPGGPEIPIQCQPDLQEIYPGIFQGLTWAEAEVRYPDLCQRLCTQLALVTIPKAETARAAQQRSQDWLRNCLHRHGAGETVWVVSHAGLLQHLVAAVLGCDRTWQIQIPHTALFEFWLAFPSDPTVDRLNPEYWKIKQFNQLPAETA